MNIREKCISIIANSFARSDDYCDNRIKQSLSFEENQAKRPLLSNLILTLTLPGSRVVLLCVHGLTLSYVHISLNTFMRIQRFRRDKCYNNSAEISFKKIYQ
jgi:hypothetical protein